MIIAIANAITNSNQRKSSDGKVPINVTLPVISGTATIGQTLTSTTGTWTSDTGVTGYLYQWYRGATLITGATNNTYVLVLADVGFDITCQVAATDTDGTSAYVSSNAIFLFDADYRAVLNRATELSYTLPTLAQQKLQNKLLMDMKTDGVWEKLDVFYNFANNGGASFGTLNWKSPTIRQCTFLPSPLNFIPNQGLQGTGTSYISTNFNPTLGGPNQYVQNNASRYFYLYNEGAGGAGTNVSLDGTTSTTINGTSRIFTSSQRINQSTTSLNSAFDFTGTRGMKSIHRTSSTNVELFNDTVQGSRTATSQAVSNSNQFILRGGSTTVFATHTVSMYAMGASLVSENTAFVNSYNTYINAI